MLARAKRGGSACFFNKNPVALSIYLVYKKKRAGGQWHSRDNLVVSGIWYLVSVVFYSSGIEWVVESVVELTGMPVLMAARWWIPPLSRGTGSCCVAWYWLKECFCVHSPDIGRWKGGACCVLL